MTAGIRKKIRTSLFMYLPRINETRVLVEAKPSKCEIEKCLLAVVVYRLK